jgi:hypothetical protein
MTRDKLIMMSGFASFSGIPGASKLQESAYKDVYSSSCSRCNIQIIHGRRNMLDYSSNLAYVYNKLTYFLVQ